MSRDDCRPAGRRLPRDRRGHGADPCIVADWGRCSSSSLRERRSRDGKSSIRSRGSDRGGSLRRCLHNLKCSCFRHRSTHRRTCRNIDSRYKKSASTDHHWHSRHHRCSNLLSAGAYNRRSCRHPSCRHRRRSNHSGREGQRRKNCFRIRQWGHDGNRLRCRRSRMCTRSRRCSMRCCTSRSTGWRRRRSASRGRCSRSPHPPDNNLQQQCGNTRHSCTYLPCMHCHHRNWAACMREETCSCRQCRCRERCTLRDSRDCTRKKTYRLLRRDKNRRRTARESMHSQRWGCCWMSLSPSQGCFEARSCSTEQKGEFLCFVPSGFL